MTRETGGNYKTQRTRWGTALTQYYNHIQKLMTRYVVTKLLTSTFLPGYETKGEEDSILIFGLLALFFLFSKCFTIFKRGCRRLVVEPVVKQDNYFSI